MFIYLAILMIIIVIIKLSVVFGIKQCTSKASMAGKVIIVTGANSGIGFETAKDLAERGGRVILACRHEGRARAVLGAIVRDTGNQDVVYKHLDLGSLESVRNFAEDVKKSEPQLDVLINNAGVHDYGDYTRDGIVEDMQVNYFGAFLLTILLLPLLKKSRSARIVNVCSLLHFFGRVNLKYINKTGSYFKWFRYSNSKLCMLLFTVELARRLKGSGVTVNAVHPGIIKTKIVGKSDVITQFIFDVICWVASRTAVEGAQTVIYLAVSDEVSNKTGKYFVDCKERYVSWKAFDKELITDLWKFTEIKVGINYE